MSALGMASLGVFCEDRPLGMSSLGVFCSDTSPPIIPVEEREPGGRPFISFYDDLDQPRREDEEILAMLAAFLEIIE